MSGSLGNSTVSYVETFCRNTIASYVDALCPIVYIKYFDFPVIDSVLKSVREAIESSAAKVEVLEFYNGLGLVDFETKSPQMECSLEQFLRVVMDEGFRQETFYVLKDIHSSLNNPAVLGLLRRMSENIISGNEGYRATIFIVSDVVVIPRELEQYITLLDVRIPGLSEINEILSEEIKRLQIGEIESNVREELVRLLSGMNEFQIRQILHLAYQQDGAIDLQDRTLISEEKKRIICKTGLLEVVHSSESISDLGGLEKLKSWLQQKKIIFDRLNGAVNFGVDIPKGILVAGMPGCGKSLTAKVAASLFKFPLVRLDIGRLLGKYVGESESNLNRALKLAEAICPCVLWIDEIEKAFAGVGQADGGGEVATRLFGQFLTWMQEKSSAIFIVATANDISRVPPEFLRRGRFDELFFVGFPGVLARINILYIHLKKRNQKIKKEVLIRLRGMSAGFSGADLEAVVRDAVERAFCDGGKPVGIGDLESSFKRIVPMSKTMSSKIKDMKSRQDLYQFMNASDFFWDAETERGII